MEKKEMRLAAVEEKKRMKLLAPVEEEKKKEMMKLLLVEERKKEMKLLLVELKMLSREASEFSEWEWFRWRLPAHRFASHPP